LPKACSTSLVSTVAPGHLIFNEYNYVYLIALKNKDSVDFL
jgi:hypothetical protein